MNGSVTKQTTDDQAQYNVVFSQVQDVLVQQQKTIEAQQKELTEIKDMLKQLLLNQQQQQLNSSTTFPSPPTPPRQPATATSNTHESDSVEDIKVSI
jgi:hypothetical protein